MYLGYYKLKSNPFRLNPDPAFVCMTMQHREALAGLVYSACTRPGLTVLLGEAGTGKTTLLYSLLDLLQRRRFVTALCTNPTLSRAEFYDFLMMQFGIDCGSSLKSRQLAAMEATLHRNRTDGRPSVLIVDEAQRLPFDLLEEIRLLLNMETPQYKLLDVVMSGQPELNETLHRPEMRQLKQRVSCVCKLRPLSVEEVKEYISHRLTLAGLGEQGLFSDVVMRRVFEYTEGIPRLVNILCDSALQTGFATQSEQITTGIVDEAARDLEMGSKPFDDNVTQGVGTSVAGLMSKPIHTDSVLRRNGGAPAANGNGTEHVSADEYSVRQRSISFFANLMDRTR